MKSLDSMCGFAVREGSRFRLGNARHRLLARDVRSLKSLQFIAVQARRASDNQWLIPLRPEIREIRHWGSSAPLARVVICTGDLQVRRLAIWLRGRCGGSVGVREVAEFSTDPEASIRKQVARCLRRLNAWQPLQEMLETETDPHIRKLCESPMRESCQDRIDQYTRHVTRRDVQREDVPLVIAPGVDFLRSQPPKSAHLIRTLLKRIRRWVEHSRNA